MSPGRAAYHGYSFCDVWQKSLQFIGFRPFSKKDNLTCNSQDIHFGTEEFVSRVAPNSSSRPSSTTRFPTQSVGNDKHITLCQKNEILHVTYIRNLFLFLFFSFFFCYLALFSVNKLQNAMQSNKTTNLEVYIGLCLGTNVFIIISTIWILISMIAYGRKTKRWKASKFDRAATDRVRVYTACVVAVVLALPRFLVDHIVFHVPRIFADTDHCDRIIDASLVFGGISMYGVYVFLWMKQKVIISHPIVKAAVHKHIKVASWVSIFAITLAAFIFIFVYTIPKNFKSNEEYRCVQVGKIYSEIYALGISSVFSQVMLLCLFIYPLIRTRKVTQNHNDSGSRLDRRHFLLRIFTCKSGHSVSGNDRVRSFMVRTLFCVAMVVFSDLSIALLVMTVFSNVPISIVLTIYDIGFLINIIAILSTFGNNVKILTIFCAKERKTKLPNSQVYRKKIHSTLPLVECSNHANNWLDFAVVRETISIKICK